MDQIELNPADIVDAVDQEIMNWLLQEEEADVVRLKDTSHVLAQEINPTTCCDCPSMQKNWTKASMMKGIASS